MTQRTKQTDSHRGDSRRDARCVFVALPGVWSLGRTKINGAVIAPAEPPG